MSASLPCTAAVLLSTYCTLRRPKYFLSVLPPPFSVSHWHPSRCHRPRGSRCPCERPFRRAEWLLRRRRQPERERDRRCTSPLGEFSRSCLGGVSSSRSHLVAQDVTQENVTFRNGDHLVRPPRTAVVLSLALSPVHAWTLASTPPPPSLPQELLRLSPPCHFVFVEGGGDQGAKCGSGSGSGSSSGSGRGGRWRWGYGYQCERHASRRRRRWPGIDDRPRAGMRVCTEYSR